MSTAKWVGLIRDAWQDSVGSVLKIGQLLIDAKAELEHGQFETMIETDLPFGPRSARMLMAIAEDKKLANRKHASVLPPSWTTLYELTKVPEDVFEAKLKEGVIRPDMQRDEAMRLHRPFGNARHEIRQETATAREAFRQGRFDPDVMWSAFLDSLIMRRKALGWSQQELDEHAGWTAGQCDKYERAERHPCRGLMEWLCALNYNTILVPRELQPGTAVAQHRQMVDLRPMPST